MFELLSRQKNGKEREKKERMRETKLPFIGRLNQLELEKREGRRVDPVRGHDYLPRPLLYPTLSSDPARGAEIGRGVKGASFSLTSPRLPPSPPASSALSRESRSPLQVCKRVRDVCIPGVSC